MRATGLAVGILCLFCCAQTSAQSNPNNTLLWRISGKGLTKPSYLFGTIHSQDKRLFNFGDSVYAAIDKVDGLALEVDFDQLVDSMVNMMFHIQEEKLMNAQAPAKDKEVGPNEIPPIDNKSGKTHVEKPAKGRTVTWSNNQMETIVDGYLYGVAQRKSKWLGGIEDPEDQLGLLDELGNLHAGDKDPNSFSNTDLEKLKTLYIQEDLGALAKMVNASSQDRFVQRLLLQRNIKMARRMDSLMAFRSMFFAVGTAHLPGDGGVIDLLRKAGYKVMPVTSSKRVQATSYLDELEHRTWLEQNIPRSGVIYQTPTPVKSYELFGGVYKIDMGFDLSTATAFMTGYLLNTMDMDDKKLGAMLEGMLSSMGAKADGPRQTITQPVKAIQQKFSAPSGYGIARFFVDNGFIYIQLVTSSEPSQLLERQGLRFFNSFRKSDKPMEKAAYNIPFENKAGGFRIMFNAKASPLLSQMQEDGTQVNSYMSIDQSNGHIYAIGLRDLVPGVESDSAVLMSYAANYMKRMSHPTLVPGKTKEGYSMLTVSGFQADKPSFMKNYMIVRGRQLIAFAEVVANGTAKDIDGSLLDRITLFPPEYPAFQSYHTDGMQYRAFGALKPDTVDTDDIQYSVRDHFNGMNLTLIKVPYYEHTWTDSTVLHFLQSQAADYVDGDSVISEGPVKNGSIQAWQSITTTEGSSTACVTRVMAQGDTVLVLKGWTQLENATNPQFQIYFNEFLPDQIVPPVFFTSHLKEVLIDMRSEDSSLVKTASEELANHSYDQKDLPLLHKALYGNYAIQSEDIDPYYTLANTLTDMEDENTVQEVVNAYHQLSPQMAAHKYELLRILASRKDKPTREIFMKLIEQGLPEGGYPYQLHGPLSDSLELIAPYFSRLLAIRGGVSYRAMLMSLGHDLLERQLIDKNGFAPYLPLMLTDVQRGVDSVRKGLAVYTDYGKQINWLIAMNDPKALTMLAPLWKLNNHEELYAFASDMISAKLPAPAAVLDTLASDIIYRGQLWGQLEEQGTTALMPLRFRTVRYLGESMIYDVSKDDLAKPSVVFLQMMKDKKGQSYHLYKVFATDEDSEEKGTYLAMVGPFKDGNDVKNIGERSWIFWAEEYDAKQLSKQFERFLEAVKAEQEAGGSE